MFTKKTDYIWESPITNSSLLADGWDYYRIVKSGDVYSLKMIMDLGEIRNYNELASGVESFDKCVAIAKEYDEEKTDYVTQAIFVIGALTSAIMIVGTILYFVS